MSMVLLLDEVAKRWEYRMGSLLILGFHWRPDKRQYVADRGEELGPNFTDACREAERLAELRRQGKTARRK